jgi:hypothetical protein
MGFAAWAALALIRLSRQRHTGRPPGLEHGHGRMIHKRWMDKRL